MHEEGVVGQSHLLAVYCPVSVSAEDLSIVLTRISRPVLCIDEVCTLECLALVIFHFCSSYKLWSQLVSLRMGDYKLIIGHVDALCK